MKPATSASEVLGSPLRINSLEIKNRIVLGPMAVLRPTDDGRPSRQSIAFLRRRAQGGVGLVFVGGAVASERAWNESPFFPNIRFDKDEFVPDLARMVVAVQEEGARDLRAALPELRPHGRSPKRRPPDRGERRSPWSSGQHGLPRSRLCPGRTHHPAAGRGDGGGHQVGRSRRRHRRAPREGCRLRRRRDRRAHVLLLLVVPLASRQPAHRRVRRQRREPRHARSAILSLPFAPRSAPTTRSASA